MKIDSLKFNIFFQKKFVSNALVVKEKTPYKCSIFEINYKDDYDYFDKLALDDKWKNSHFLDEQREDFELDITDEQIFVMENNQNDCLGFICVSNAGDNKTKEVSILETCPEYSYRNKRSKYRYIGESLLAFVVKLTKEQKMKILAIPIASKKAHGFYEKCGFQKGQKGAFNDFYLKKKNFNSFIEQNNQHTQV